MKNNLAWLLILALTCVVTLIPDRYSYSSPKPFEIYMGPKSMFIVTFCESRDGRAQKFARSKLIADTVLSISDFIHESGDAAYVGMRYKNKDGLTLNKDMHESFNESIQKYNNDKEFAQYISGEKSREMGRCFDEESKKRKSQL